jgi:MFS family permease
MPDHAVSTAPQAKVSWLSPGVKGIGTASFLADVGHEIPTALLPSFLTSTLGVSAAALGLIEGVSDGLAGTARLAGGALADDPVRRRSIAVGGYATTAVLSSLIGVSTGAGQAALLRAGAWSARGLRVPARNALLADLVPPEVYGRAYGFERMMDNLGAIGGPLLALALVSLVSVRTAILASVVPGLLAALAILYAIRHIPHPTTKERQPVRLRIRAVIQGSLRPLFTGISAFELGNVAATLLILRATQLLAPAHGEHAATQLALAGYILYNVAATLTSLPAGRLGDERGPIGVLTLGVICFLVAYLGFAVGATAVVFVGASFAVAGVAIGAIETAEHAAVATLAPTHLRGSAFGLLAAMQGFGNLIASSIAGLLWRIVSGRAAFLYLVICMLVAVVPLTRLARGAKLGAS